MLGASTWRSRVFFFSTALFLAGSFLDARAQAPEYSADIHISEFLPNPIGDDATLEFVELHNDSDIDVNLLGWGVDTGGSAHFVITENIILPPHGFLAFFSAQKPISLTNTGDTIKLIAPDLQIHDQVTYATSKEGYSYNRIDGGVYIQSSVPTPNADNIFDSTPTPTSASTQTPTAPPSPSPSASVLPSIAPKYSESIRINEFIPNPVGGDAKLEFVELYNNSDQVVDLSGWKLDDVADGGSSPFVLPDGVTLSARGYIVFYSDQTKISLNNDSEHVRLLRPDGVVVADIGYLTSKEGYSYNYVDGNDFQQSSHITPGEENIIELPYPAPTATPKITSTPKLIPKLMKYDFSARVVINEIYPAPTKEDKNNEFIEIKNLDNRSISLVGWTLDDGGAGSRPYHFKSTDIIGVKKIMAVDKTSTKIALNNSDDSARLIDPQGKVIAILAYQKTYSGQSLSRGDDGAYAWTEIVTPNQENIISVHNVESSEKALEKKKKVATKQSRVAGVTTHAPFTTAPTPLFQWPSIVPSVVVRTTYGKDRVSPIRNQKQGMFVFLGILCAGSQLVAGISRKEKIWFG